MYKENVSNEFKDSLKTFIGEFTILCLENFLIPSYLLELHDSSTLYIEVSVSIANHPKTVENSLTLDFINGRKDIKEFAREYFNGMLDTIKRFEWDLNQYRKSKERFH